MFFLLMTLVLVHKLDLLLYTYHVCIIDAFWNKLFLRLDIYTPSVVAMVVCWIMQYWYSSLLGFNCTFQLYSSWFSLLKYWYRYHVTLCIGQLHPITFYKLFFWYALFWCSVSLCVPFINSFIACYSKMMFVTVIGMFMSMAIHFDQCI